MASSRHPKPDQHKNKANEYDEFVKVRASKFRWDLISVPGGLLAPDTELTLSSVSN